MDDWGRYIEAVAEALLGQPTSRKGGKLRYGSNGSLQINTETGWFDDFEAGDSGKGRGGGVLALIKREKGLDPKEAIEWMKRDLGLAIEDNRFQSDRAPRAQRERAPDRDPGPPANSETTKPKAKPKLVCTYNYTAENGDLLFQVCRMEPKNFLQRRAPRPDDNPADIKNGWVWKRDGIGEMVPYRLPELLEAIAEDRTVFVVEGEKDVDNLAEDGVVASCNPGGAGKWPDELTRYFKDADVVIIRDNDPQAINKQTGELRFHPDGRPVLPGQDHGDLVASKLKPVARRVRILDLPDLPLKGDASDWLAAGNQAVELYRLADAIGVAYQPRKFASKFGAVLWGEPRTSQQPYEYIVKGMIPAKETVLIYGASQSGKSFYTQDLGMGVARGISYLGRKVKRGIIVYCAAEAGHGFVAKRFDAYAVGQNVPVDAYLPFFCLTKKFDLFGSETQVVELIAEIKALVALWNEMFPDDQLELMAVVIDTLNKTTPGMDEISGKEVGLVMSRLDMIREQCNCGLWLVHHMNAGGTGPRGHTSLYAAFETAIKVGRYDHTEKDAPAKIKDNGREKDRRFTQFTKQREGEDGEVKDFYLRGVVCGYDEDGAPIPGATVAWIDKEAAPKAEVGISMTDQYRNVYRALRRAIEDFGVPPPPRLQLPKSVTKVVDRKFWGQVYRQNFAEEDSQEAIKKALQRGNNFMITRGIIARDNPWVWITGKAVRGETQKVVVDEDIDTTAAGPSDEAGPDWENMTSAPDRIDDDMEESLAPQSNDEPPDEVSDEPQLESPVE